VNDQPGHPLNPIPGRRALCAAASFTSAAIGGELYGSQTARGSLVRGYAARPSESRSDTRGRLAAAKAGSAPVTGSVGSDVRLMRQPAAGGASACRYPRCLLWRVCRPAFRVYPLP
jgi:hypothetical protein